jgi:cytochrome c-type biogenesis protein CcmH
MKHFVPSLVVMSLLLLMTLALPAGAVDPDEILPDPQLEARARDISADLRCLVCQNQTIDDSHSGLARDLRRIVRERLSAGDSNDQVRSFMVQRFGHYILLKPPFQSDTLALWILPFVALAGAGAMFLGFVRRHRPMDEALRDGANEDDTTT